jgi:hypothetical protein
MTAVSKYEETSSNLEFWGLGKKKAKVLKNLSRDKYNSYINNFTYIIKLLPLNDDNFPNFLNRVLLELK